MNKNNIIICSKNRTIEEPSSSKVSVLLNNELSCSENEYFTVNIVSFNMIKSFYCIQNQLNNIFYIILRKPNDNNEYIRYIPTGNYNIDSILVHLNTQCFGLIDITYNETFNKFNFIKKINESTDGYDVFIKPTNSGEVLGLLNNVEFPITFEGQLSTTFINISGYSTLLLKMSGISIDNSYVNLTTANYGVSQIIGLINVAGIIPMDSITYESTNDNKYIIKNKKINSFNIEIVNENNLNFPQMSDYILHLNFEKHLIKSDEFIKSILSKLNDIIFYIVYFFQKAGISPE